jgi:hypothetical protein
MAFTMTEYTSAKVVLDTLKVKAEHAKNVAHMAELKYNKMNAHFLAMKDKILQLKKDLQKIDDRVLPAHPYDSPETRRLRNNSSKQASRERLILLGLDNKRTESDRIQERVDDAVMMRSMPPQEALEWLKNKEAERELVTKNKRKETKKIVNEVYAFLSEIE